MIELKRGIRVNVGLKAYDHNILLLTKKEEVDTCVCGSERGREEKGTGDIVYCKIWQYFVQCIVAY